MNKIKAETNFIEKINNNLMMDQEAIKVSNSNEDSSLKNEEYIVTIDEVLDKIGYTRFHLIMIIIVGLSLASDGVELYLIYLISPVLKKIYKLDDNLMSIIVSSIFLGIAIGAISSGILVKQHGRRNVMLFFLLTIALFGTVCVLIQNIYWFLFCRFIIGISIGVLFNLTNALCEVLPRKYRDFIMGSIYFYVKLGIVYFVFIFFVFTNNTDPIYNYQTIVIISSIPMYLCLFLAFVYYEESPRIMIWTHNKFDEGFKLIEKISEGSGYMLNDYDKKGIINDVNRSKIKKSIDEDNPINIIKMLFKKKYTKLFILVTFLWILNSLVLFTNLYSLPSLLNMKSLEKNLTLYNKSFLENNINSNSHFLKNNTFEVHENIEVLNFRNLTANITNFQQSANEILEAKEKSERHEKIKKILISNLIPIPAEFLAGLLTSVPLFGRKYTMFLGFFFEMIFALMMILDSENLYLYSSMIMFFNVFSFNICKLYTTEAFHTEVRDTAYGFSNFCSRIAAVFIPYITKFTFKYSTYGPCILMTALSFCGFVICLLLPFDTCNRPLDCLIKSESKEKNKM